MEPGKLEDWNPLRHRFLTARQYAIAAAAAGASALLWWAISRRICVLEETLLFGLVIPLGAHRDRERTALRVLWALFAGAVVAAGDTWARRNGWIR